MNKRKIGKEFEREAYEILKQKFDRVHWLSKSNASSYDFQCFKDGKSFYGDAKLLASGKITLKFTQKDADFVIAKVNGKIIFLWKEEFGNKVLIERFKLTTIQIGRDLWNKLNLLKYQWGCKNQQETIEKLLELATPKLETQSKNQNSSTTPLFSEDSNGGADHNQEKEE